MIEGSSGLKSNKTQGRDWRGIIRVEVMCDRREETQQTSRKRDLQEGQTSPLTENFPESGKSDNVRKRR